MLLRCTGAQGSPNCIMNGIKTNRVPQEEILKFWVFLMLTADYFIGIICCNGPVRVVLVEMPLE